MRPKKVKKGNAAVVAGRSGRFRRIAHLGRDDLKGPTRMGTVRPGRPYGRGRARERDGEGAADGKCEHKIRQMKTYCTRDRAPARPARLSFGVVRSLPRGETTPLRRYESEVHRTAARHAQGYFKQETCGHNTALSYRIKTKD